ncbi:MAG: threonine--tRNA ligase, partial [bacterium]
MANLRFPDGSIVEVPYGKPLKDLLEYLPQSVRKKVVCAKIDDEIVDLSATPSHDGLIRFITFDDIEGKSVYWHSTAHIM